MLVQLVNTIWTPQNYMKYYHKGYINDLSFTVSLQGSLVHLILIGQYKAAFETTKPKD